TQLEQGNNLATVLVCHGGQEAGFLHCLFLRQRLPAVNGEISLRSGCSFLCRGFFRFICGSLLRSVLRLVGSGSLFGRLRGVLRLCGGGGGARRRGIGPRGGLG